MARKKTSSFLFCSAEDIKTTLKNFANAQKAYTISKFFKTGSGEYAECDIFWGITVPQIRSILPLCAKVPLGEIEKLLADPIHECRLCAVLILVEQYCAGDEILKRNIFDFYLSHTNGINNWDIVDLSAPKIVGDFLLHHKNERKILFALATTNNLWERRIAIVSTLALIKNGEFTDTFEIIKILINDQHHLIHKAAGWMLREIGKVNFSAEKSFLDEYCTMLPRTTVRYAIERFPAEMRNKYLSRKSRIR
ncbi:MAG: DNA alkylation repair protein [Spirochaetes bacterium]|nr:DNA alkylation repair protein [Spirochaetota bacterium]